MALDYEPKHPQGEITWFAHVACKECKRMFLREVASKEEMMSLLTNSGWKFSQRKGWFCGVCAADGDTGYTRTSASDRQMELLDLLAKERRWRPTKFSKMMGVSRQAIYNLRYRLQKKNMLPPLRPRSSTRRKKKG